MEQNPGHTNSRKFPTHITMAAIVPDITAITKKIAFSICHSLSFAMAVRMKAITEINQYGMSGSRIFLYPFVFLFIFPISFILL